MGVFVIFSNREDLQWQFDMRQLLNSRKIVIATHNAGKLQEITNLISPYKFEIQSAIELRLPIPREIGTSFEENAYIKAFSAAEATGLPAISDDSGLEIDILSGAPGIYTANWAEQPDGARDFSKAMRKVEDLLQKVGATNVRRRSSHFVSVICIAWPDKHAEYFRGEIKGTLVWPPRGHDGFGFDPMFQPEGSNYTFGEMSPDEKHSWKHGDKTALSHRARAFKYFAESIMDKK